MTARRLGSYELLSQLSRGGMGEVWIAKRHGSHGFEKLVALKTIRRDARASDALREMFLEEARVSSFIQHPAVAQVFDFGDEDGQLFLAMEYVAGLSLSRLRSTHGEHLSADVAVRIVADVCRGLHAAHEVTDLTGRKLGLVHRDVSPQNLMLTFDGHVKVIDFGIAVAADRLAAATGQRDIVGKPAYMAPEQLQTSSAIDRRADIFSATVVLHELVAKQRLFLRPSLQETVDAVRNEVVPPLVGPDVPAELDTIVQRGLARDRTDRYGTAAQLADALEALAETMGGDSLRVFAEQAIGRQRHAHDELLREIVTANGGRSVPAQPQRTELGTMVGLGRAFSSVDDGDGESTPAADTVSMRGAASSRRWPVVAILGALLTVSGVWWFGAARAPRASTESPTPTFDGGTARTAAAVVEPAAAVVEPAVAAAEPDAGVRRRIRERRRPSRRVETRVEPPDAGRSEVPKGRLVVTATPWAEVWIDGRYVDKTPLRRQLSVGPHDVELRSPDTNAVRERRTVTIVRGTTERVIVRATAE